VFYSKLEIPRVFKGLVTSNWALGFPKYTTEFQSHTLWFSLFLVVARRSVPGLAIGVGTTMLLHCDLVFMAEGTKLSTPFVNLALVPEAASSLLLPARIGHARAFAMFALGEAVSAADALSLGLANKVLPKDEVLPAAREAARTLATRPLGAIVATKRLMRDTQRILDRMAEEGALFAQRLQTKEAREAFSAFAERRQPDFTKLAS
jgi:enoyl-CoA hydratase/carnithine racemase